MNMNSFAIDVHDNAVAHGWWEDPSSFGEIIALCHSELSEALEEVRAGRPMLWYACTEAQPAAICSPLDTFDCSNAENVRGCTHRSSKPEGIAVELADCIIRILGWFGREGLEPVPLIAEAKQYMMCDVPVPLYTATLGGHIARWHLLLSLAYSCWSRSSGTYAAALRMALCVHEIMEWAKSSDVDMELLLSVKHSYNVDRPYRHGGKVL